jgi:RNA polymerase sigma-70 factor (ECF subfamily)
MSVQGEDQDDRTLVRQFKATGDPAWFAPLYERHEGRIYALCYGLVRNRAQAEDLVQETFMRAFERINRFDEQAHKSEFLHWLLTIARNLCLSELRNTSRSRAYEAEVQRLPGDDPHDERSREEAVMLLREIEVELGSMEEPYRRCWLLFYLDGYSYAEIAERTGYSLQEVKSHLRAVRRRLERRFT